jgi:PAS domain S-box-containing protein
MVLGAYKVLYVHESAGGLAMLEQALKSASPESQVLAAQGDGAWLAVARAQDPDAIILSSADLAVCTCFELKKDPLLKLIPTILLTDSRTSEQDRARALDAGLESFISLPLSPMELVAKLRAMARLKAAGQAQALAQDAEQKLKNIIEFLPDATFVIDQDKRVIAWNRACELMTGVKKQDVLGQGDYAYALPFFKQRCPVLIDLLDPNTGEAEAKYKYVKRMGDVVLVESYIPHFRQGQGAHLWGAATPLFDPQGQRCGAIEVIRDMTDQKLVEQALLESERKYRELVECANSIILRWTHEGRITFLNEFGQRFFGYAAHEILGRHVLGTIVPGTDSEGQDMARLMEGICADPAAFERNVNENMRRDGSRVWVTWTNRIVWDAHGKVDEILSVGTDITELKRAEEEIRELNAGLEARVAERTAELAVARDRAEAADRLKSAFLANMSHELRTPLNSIIGFTGIILQGLAGPLNPEQQKQLGMVRESARHLLALINDVLDISKIEAAQVQVRSEAFDLREALAKVAGIVKPLADKKGLALRVELGPQVGAVNSDRRRVEQVLLNLLNNAIKFTEQGQVALAARVAEGAAGAASSIQMSVADTGMGIKPEDLNKLFQPFQQIDSGLSRLHEGTGLGLAICARLAGLLGGEVRVASEWGKGSTFTFILPLQRPSHAA